VLAPMGSTNAVTGPASVMTAVTESPDALDDLGETVLKLVRRAADAGSNKSELPAGDVLRKLLVRMQVAEDRLTTLEADCKNHPNNAEYLENANRLLVLAERRLVELTGQFNANTRKFVDTVALLESADRKNSELRKELEEKEHEVKDLKRSCVELVEHLKILVKFIDESGRTTAFHPAGEQPSLSHQLLPR
jgi:predicted RNase H-like nuclease (RuvC/YqgF family)